MKIKKKTKKKIKKENNLIVEAVLCPIKSRHLPFSLFIYLYLQVFIVMSCWSGPQASTTPLIACSPWGSLV